MVIEKLCTKCGYVMNEQDISAYMNRLTFDRWKHWRHTTLCDECHKNIKSIPLDDLVKQLKIQFPKGEYIPNYEEMAVFCDQFYTHMKKGHKSMGVKGLIAVGSYIFSKLNGGPQNQQTMQERFNVHHYCFRETHRSFLGEKNLRKYKQRTQDHHLVKLTQQKVAIMLEEELSI